MNNQVVTRFAPSPTGFMHVGGVRTALYAWLFARKHNGKFILRIEDTDKAREVEGSIDHIVESLRWLGISWDEGVDIGGPHAPYLQSERLHTYTEYAHKLIEKGYAYPDPYSEEEISQLRAQAEANKELFLYRNHRPSATLPWDGKTPLRFKVKNIKTTKWHDAVRGDLEAGEEALDDFILIKGDGYPTYNFAHIIDDLLMGVTHIMRADEFIASTPKFIALYEALDITPPILVTLPPILGPGGNKKLSKRDGAKDVLDYRKEGYLPSAILNFFAFLGWNPGGEKEIYTPEELIESFSIERIHKSGAQLQEEKLEWVNKEHIKLQTKADQLKAVTPFTSGLSDEMREKLLDTLVDRVSHYGQLYDLMKDEFAFFVHAKVIAKEKILWKDSPEAEAITHLSYIKDVLSSLQFLSIEEIKSAIFPYADEKGRGNVLWPLRMSLSRQEKSVDPFTICYVLGKEESIRRITEALDILQK